MTILYNLIMAAVDLAALAFAARKKSSPAWCAGMACAATLALLLALVLGEDRFGVLRLAAWGVFLHGPVLLMGLGVVGWRTSRVTAIGSTIIAAGILVVAVDAFLIEPTWLEVSHREIRSEKIRRPIRIVVLADLQTDRIGQYERNVLRRALQQEPDLVLLAGDYIQAGGPQRQELYARLNAFLRQLGLPGPGRVFAVQGNVDADDWPEMFRGTPVVPVSSTQSFAVAGIQLTCLARRDSFSRSLEVDAPEADRFHLVLGHSPDFALGRIEADLLLAGHTHGGQVRLPLVGPRSRFRPCRGVGRPGSATCPAEANCWSPGAWAWSGEAPRDSASSAGRSFSSSTWSRNRGRIRAYPKTPHPRPLSPQTGRGEKVYG